MTILEQRARRERLLALRQKIADLGLTECLTEGRTIAHCFYCKTTKDYFATYKTGYVRRLHLARPLHARCSIDVPHQPQAHQLRAIFGTPGSLLQTREERAHHDGERSCLLHLLMYLKRRKLRMSLPDSQGSIISFSRKDHM